MLLRDGCTSIWLSSDDETGWRFSLSDLKDGFTYIVTGRVVLKGTGWSFEVKYNGRRPLPPLSQEEITAITELARSQSEAGVV